MWANPANWVNVTPGGTATFPDADDNAAFYANHQVTNGAAANLTNSGTTWIGPGSVTVNDGVILNHGLLTYVGAAGTTDENLVINDSVLLTGAGTLQLVPGGDSFVTRNANLAIDPLNIRDVLTNDVNHTIRGAGELFIDTVNGGTISADVSGQVLRLRSLANSAQFAGSLNRGLVSVANGGIFELANGLLDNRNGTLASDSSGTVTINGELLGGTLVGGMASPATLLGAGTLNAVSFAGQFQIGNGARPRFAGTITNQGRIMLSQAGNGLFVSDIVTLQGAGVLELNAGINAVQLGGLPPDVLINAAGHTIRSGALSASSIINLDFINRGKVIAGLKGQVALTLGNSNSNAAPLINSGEIQVLPNATLQFNARRIDNTGGVLNLEDGSRLSFASVGSLFGGRIVGGTVSGVVIAAANASLGDTTFSGNLSFAQSSGTFFGTIVNNGQTSVNSLGISKTVTLAGEGQLILLGGGRGGGGIFSGAESTTTSPARLINTGNHTIRGDSTISIPVVNEARLQPGTMSITSLSLGSASELIIAPINLTQFGSVRTIDPSSAINLDGELVVDFQGNYIPGPRTFDILSAVVISGDFSTFSFNAPNLPWIGPVSYEIIPNATAGSTIDVVRLTINNGVSGLAGDFNNDGFVDAGDYTLWRDRPSGLTFVANDPTPAFFNDRDHAVWAANFGRSWLGAPATPVPEAHARLLALLAIGAMMVGGRRSAEPVL